MKFYIILGLGFLVVISGLIFWATQIDSKARQVCESHNESLHAARRGYTICRRTDGLLVDRSSE